MFLSTLASSIATLVALLAFNQPPSSLTSLPVAPTLLLSFCLHPAVASLFTLLLTSFLSMSLIVPFVLYGRFSSCSTSLPRQAAASDDCYGTRCLTVCAKDDMPVGGGVSGRRISGGSGPQGRAWPRLVRLASGIA